MKNARRSALLVAFVAAVATGCSNMSQRDKDTAIGAGVGGVAGNVITGGSTAGTLGGAAVGGYIGNRYGK